jgi:hypothetical protein
MTWRPEASAPRWPSRDDIELARPKSWRGSAMRRACYAVVAAGSAAALAFAAPAAAGRWANHPHSASGCPTTSAPTTRAPTTIGGTCATAPKKG